MGGAQPLAVDDERRRGAGDRSRRGADRAPPGHALRRRGHRFTRRGAGAVRRVAGGAAPRDRSPCAATPPRCCRRSSRRGLVPDVVTDQTSAHDAVGGYVPDGLTLAQAASLRAADPRAYEARSVAAMGRHVARDAGAQAARRGRVRLRQQHPRPGGAGRRRRRLRDSRLRARVRAAALLRGQGPVPLGGALGRSRRPAGHRRGRARDVRRRRGAVPLDSPRPGAGRLPGPAGADLLARLRRSRTLRAAAQPAGARRTGVGADRRSAAIISTPARWPRPTARPRPCATAATRSPTGRC